ncbi:flagellar biosynthetic protein FlhB [Sphingomonas jejuensis]|uniref:Flagellar biosynthetic protein FlhB n=1 Tax=Sphingomonas jejuensis TaxID=904715 RepID=A0ABX0XMY2_9SPHN|nr:flagellar type III secretion system protein FlhB [Sphingomonas jejuensis]NJC34739.1 flagellar biosynthetic protein FlhB [Sphingomonas jejuensis]
MSESAGEKTEAPTPKRRKDAADKGEILRSKEFATAAVVLAGVIWLAMAGPMLMGAFKALLTESLQFDARDVNDFQPLRPILAVGALLGPAIATLFAITILAAVASQAGLGSARFNAKMFEFKGSRINPGAGLKRMFGMQGLIELGKSLLKVVLLAAIGTWLLWSIADDSLGLAAGDLHASIGTMGHHFITILLVMAGGLLLIAGIDVPIQLVRLLGKLRMTKQEVLDEHKEAEGRPEMKAAQRRRQHEITKGGMRKALEGAQVVLTNPTHFAVALRYDRGRDEVPVVVAKGRGATALAIREVAGEKQIPVLEYPALARAVYYTSREGQQVRDDLYLAIATVLAFVFGVNRDAGGQQPHILVPDTALFDENGKRQTR